MMLEHAEHAISIRRADVSDAAGIAAVRVASWRAAYHDLVPATVLEAMDQAEIESWFVKWLGLSEIDGFVAEAKGRVVGFTLLRQTRDDDCAPDTGEIPTFYVAPDYWRHGIGRLLCTVTLDRAGERGMTAVCLWVISGNQRARTFYEEMGFFADGGAKTDVEFVGAPLHEVRYRREVGE
jgi:GNAT superfamily N-acetyltransferase